MRLEIVSFMIHINLQKENFLVLYCNYQKPIFCFFLSFPFQKTTIFREVTFPQNQFPNYTKNNFTHFHG